MVEQVYELNAVFRSLGDPTRRDILKRVSRRSMSIGDIAGHYELTFAAVAKHLTVLEHAGLVSKTRRGKEQIVAIAPEALAAASDCLETYQQLWEQRLGRLNTYLQASNTKKKEYETN